MSQPLPKIVETSIFTKQVERLLRFEEYLALQSFLARHPDAGNLIPGTKGLRKLRWRTTGRGKRGGVRVIYYWASREGMILMLYMYSKTERSDLTPAQLEILRRVVEEELGGG